MTTDAVKCPNCGAAAELVEVGSASGRAHYRCSDRDCNAQWRAKDPAAVALGSLGGKARAAALTEAERARQSEHAANTRWRSDKLKQNNGLTPLKRRA